MEQWRDEESAIIGEAKQWITDWLKDNKYDSMYLAYDNGVGGRSTDALIVLNENQVKSADPVTYDDKGKVIPLSERFNSESNDIRYSFEDPNTLTNNAKAHWTVDNGIMTTEEYNIFNRYVDEIYHGNVYPKTTDGVYVLDMGHIIVYTDANYENPDILSVVEIDAPNVSDRNDIRNYLIDSGKMGPYSTLESQIEILNNSHTNSNIIRHNASDYKTNAGQNRRGNTGTVQANRGSTNAPRAGSIGDRYSDEAYERTYTTGNTDGGERFIESRAKETGYSLDRQGRYYVQPGAPRKRADAYTFDDNGNLIPQSQRLNPNNPDEKFSIDTDALTSDQITNMDKDVDIALNIRNTKAKFVDRILSGEKTIETRSMSAAEKLKLKVGDKVGIVDTGKKNKPLRGYAEIVDIIEYPGTPVGIKKFREDEERFDGTGHFVEEDSKYDIDEGGKVGYVLKVYKAIDRENWIPTTQDGNNYGVRSLKDSNDVKHSYDDIIKEETAEAIGDEKLAELAENATELIEAESAQQVTDTQRKKEIESNKKRGNKTRTAAEDAAEAKEIHERETMRKSGEEIAVDAMKEAGVGKGTDAEAADIRAAQAVALQRLKSMTAQERLDMVIKSALSKNYPTRTRTSQTARNTFVNMGLISKYLAQRDFQQVVCIRLQ